MTKKTFSLKKSLIIFSGTLVAFLTLGGAVFLFLQERDAPTRGAMPTQPAYRMQAEGLRFYGTNQGRRVISIAADRFTLRKGKIGFFSTGLTQRALIENGVIEIYAGAASSPEAVRAGASATVHPGGNPPDIDSARGVARQPAAENNQELSLLFGEEAKQESDGSSPAERVDFGALFAEETFSSLLPTRNIAEIEVAPVTVRLHGNRGILTQITAAGAAVRLKEREILFTGNVRVSASDAELTTDRLSFFPETTRLQTDRPFILRQGRRTLEGAGFSSDIFLKRPP
jgi:hypothetical protein